MPETNSDFWKAKIDANIARDNDVNQYYSGQGWRLLRIWEHEVKQDSEGVVSRIINSIDEAKKTLRG